MRAVLLPDAESDLEQAQDYYEATRTGLELVAAFRRAVDQIIALPQSWHQLARSIVPPRDPLRWVPLSG